MATMEKNGTRVDPVVPVTAPPPVVTARAADVGLRRRAPGRGLAEVRGDHARPGGRVGGLRGDPGDLVLEDTRANATYVFSDLNTWGWIVMGLGIASIFAAFGVFSGSELARWFGITVAGLNLVGQLMFLHANPWWSMTVITLDILIIYALAAFAGHKLRAG